MISIHFMTAYWRTLSFSKSFKVLFATNSSMLFNCSTICSSRPLSLIFSLINKYFFFFG